MTAERVAEAMRIRAQRKLWNGGPVPFGFEHERQEKTLRVNPKEASVVRMIYDYYVETASLRGTRFIILTAKDTGQDGKKDTHESALLRGHGLQSQEVER